MSDRYRLRGSSQIDDVLECVRCGAFVFVGRMIQHDDWHDRIDYLDLAQRFHGTRHTDTENQDHLDP